MLETLLEPVQADEHNGGVYENRIADACNKYKHNLLVEVECVEINGVQAGLGRRSGGEE